MLYLEKLGYNTLGVSRKPKNKKEVSYAELKAGYWNNAIAMIHLAGKAHDLKNVADGTDYYTINTELTKNLFDQFCKSDCPIFIYFSSVKAVADSIEKKLTEDQIPEPKTHYGKSKFAAERYLLSHELPSNKKIYILRPCMIHGPKNKGNLNLLYNFVKMGIPYPLGSYKNKRSFLSIDNLCFVIENLIKKKPESVIFNVADDKPLSTVEVVKLIGDSLEKKVVVISPPKKIIHFISKIGGYLKLPFNEENLVKLTENYVVDNSLIKTELKISLPVTSEEGLAKTLKSFK
ncbi:MAG: NAD-dependent epimerase/dehydratase family protein [Flavobacterium sp.]|nr:NAD-dependent epimerase/dehydratase family protein [Flavobacterium sp.]